jgi:cathepsin D
VKDSLSFAKLNARSCAWILVGFAPAASFACGVSAGESPRPSGDMGHETGGAQDASTDARPASQPAQPVGSLIAVPLEACTPLLYTAKVAIGSQTFQLAVDTGSTTLGVASSGCRNCDVSPLYAPGSTALDVMRTATSHYGTGSWTAEVYEDAVGFVSGPTVLLRFAAITTQKNFFEPVTCTSGGGYQGILGLDRATSEAAGTTAFFDRFVAAKGIANVFATKLCDTGGTLWLGGYDTTAATAAPQYTPVTTDTASTYYYTVDLESIEVAGASSPIAIAGRSAYHDTVVDTGTTAFVVPNSVLDDLAGAIARSPGFSQLFGGDAGASWFSTETPCGAANATKAQIDAALPSLTMTFGKNPGRTISMAASDSYFVRFPGYGWCSLLSPVPAGISFPFAAIVGSPFLRTQITIFDRANGRIGFAPHAGCAGH